MTREFSMNQVRKKGVTKMHIIEEKLKGSLGRPAKKESKKVKRKCLPDKKH